MAEIFKNGVPHLLHEHGSFRLVVPPHVLKSQAHDFRKDTLLYTKFRGVLPSTEFSLAQFNAMQDLAETDQSSLLTAEAAFIARALLVRKYAAPVSFNPTTGCWRLPLKAEYDAANRARYPHLAIAQLGIKNTSAHQLSYQYFLGEEIPVSRTKERGILRRQPVDHLCHDHSCCNPYHLQVVSTGENSRRGMTVREAKLRASLFQLPAGEIPYKELLSYLSEQEALIRLKEQRESVVASTSSDESFLPEIEIPTLFDEL